MWRVEVKASNILNLGHDSGVDISFTIRLFLLPGSSHWSPKGGGFEVAHRTRLNVKGSEKLPSGNSIPVVQLLASLASL